MAHISKIITINGASNTGKTTVSDLLTHIRPMTVKIELDSLGVGHTTRHLPRATKDYVLKKFGNTILEDCATLAINWIDRECDVVYPGLFPIKGFEEFRTHMKKRLGKRQVEYYCFTLKPPLEIAVKNRGPRILDEKEKEFITDLYSWLYEPSYGIVIDNQAQTPEQTADLIASHIRDGQPEARS